LGKVFVLREIRLE